MHRFFILNKQDNPREIIIPEKEIFHQVTNVLRMKQNTNFVCIYENLELLCILGNDNNFIVVEVMEFNIEKNVKLTLIQALPTNKKVPLIIQKATELDVDEIVLFQSKRSTSKIKDFSSKEERFNKIIIEACEQCRRNDIPDLRFISSIEDFDFSNKNSILLDEDEKKLNIKTLINDQKDIVLIIGPEGGWEQTEREFFISKGVSIATLGSNTLRTETASIAALAITSSILER